MKRPFTTKDVAKKAGVSQSTVSRVLNDNSIVKDATKEKVLNAIKEMEFIPNHLARSIVLNQTYTIGVVVGDISNPFYAEIIKEIIRESKKLGYDIIIFDTDYDYDNFDDSIQKMLNNRVDGILIAATYKDDSKINLSIKLNIPILFFNLMPHDKSYNYVIADNNKGTYLSIKHLWDLNHRKLSILSYPKSFPTYFQRYEDYIKACNYFGIDIDKRHIYKEGFSYEGIINFINRVMKEDDSPTAFVTTTDQQAIVVLEALKRLDLNVPKDISVIGFGNINLTKHPYINLTTVSIQKKNMGMIAVRKLIDLINKKKSVEQVVLRPSLIIRGTTARLNNRS